jgi:DHA2 family methylenomycin A resistance protein-like MFS transporter
VYLSGFALFTLASLLCSLVPTLNLLIASRAIQGIGAAMLVPGSLSLLTHLYADPEARARAVGIWAGVAGISFASGPIIGGLLIDSLGWRSIFLLNVPVGIVAFELTRRFVSETPQKVHTGFDLVGQLLAITTLFTFTFALIEGQHEGWKSPLILGALFTSGISAVLFIVGERLNRSPMLPLQLFTSSTFSAANVLGFLYNYSLYGLFFMFSLYLQDVRHYSASSAGLAFFPLTAVAGIIAPFAGRVMAHTGLRLSLFIGQVSACVAALTLLFVGSKTDNTVILIGFALFGVGGGFSMPAITAAVLASVPKEQSGIASAVLNTARQVGSVVGVALVGVMVNRNLFVAGMHFALAVIAMVFFIGCILTLAYVPRKSKTAVID